MQKVTFLKAVPLALALGGIATQAQAMVGASVGVSTLGAGVSLSVPLDPHTLSLRVGVNHYSKDHDGTYNTSTGSFPYTATAKLQTIPVLIDYFPFHGVFRLTAGVMVNNSEFDATGSGGSGTYTINNTVYNASTVGTLNAALKFRRTAPYVGIGVGDTSDHGLSGGMDIGVMFQGSPEFSLSATNPTNNAQLASDIAAEQRSGQEKVNKYKYWPVIGVHVGYTF